MLYVPPNTYEHRPYSATLYPTSFTLDFLLALTICAQRKTHGLYFTLGPMACVLFSCVYIFWDERGGGLTPVGLLVDTVTIRTVLSTNRVDLGSFGSRYCTSR